MNVLGLYATKVQQELPSTIPEIGSGGPDREFGGFIIVKLDIMVKLSHMATAPKHISACGRDLVAIFASVIQQTLREQYGVHKYSGYT